MQRLEAALRMPPLVRNTREVVLSPAGQTFLPQARAVIDALDGAVRDVGQPRGTGRRI